MKKSGLKRREYFVVNLNYYIKFAICMERQSDDCWLKAENQHEGHPDSGWQAQMEMGRPCGKNGPAQIGTRYISVGRKDRQKEKEETEDPVGRHIQRLAREQWSRTAKTRDEWSRYAHP
jgi:hypothetical protein